MQITLTLSEAAIQYIHSMIVKEQGIAFRLAIKKTGCSGHAYVPSVIHTVNEQDVLVPLSTDFNFYVDKQSVDLLQDLHIDYIEENKMGLKQKKLVYINPQEASRCGCGESFNLKKD